MKIDKVVKHFTQSAKEVMGDPELISCSPGFQRACVLTDEMMRSVIVGGFTSPEDPHQILWASSNGGLMPYLASWLLKGGQGFDLLEEAFGCAQRVISCIDVGTGIPRGDRERHVHLKIDFFRKGNKKPFLTLKTYFGLGSGMGDVEVFYLEPFIKTLPSF